MRHKNLLTFSISLLLSFHAFAQREVQMLQYLVNPMAINPAYAGVREVFHMNAVLRRQWVINLPGLPMSQTVAMDGAVGKDNNIGLGLQALNDRTSGLNNTGLATALSYHYRLSETQKLSVGGQLGFNMLPVYSSVSFQSTTSALISYGVGVRYEDEGLWVGISMPEIANKSFSNVGSALSAALSYSRPLMANVGLKLNINNDLVLKPSILISKQTGRSMGFDLNTEAVYMERFSGALAFRRSNSISGTGRGYFYGQAAYNASKNMAIGLTFSSTVPEAWLGNGRGIFELFFTFVPNPKL